ncbi:hypothetical protein TVAG_377880 [Trichomonas vaginalis G3]|uniref:Uncharacterized protein n=1 Tax=Trichomonas vaginalis (strain ATCC PRA-98 / G3) TaxID=412133 RepID=A2DAX9_TRIV3|nr:hypothetical protein TVAGG3_0517790 [Trichomonas vaginalis G3]EAY22309.1 hypothetical protein TVAG_377880 [Trichomonas vaginalis G3]KAI5518247.1 hypothetical protein TVAGG3_0517790 [Trichomonas vaginalis G3]|eukprot:XP_001583295.1 hypothetical protein [Trichomonas vaginalis G3]
MTLGKREIRNHKIDYREYMCISNEDLCTEGIGDKKHPYWFKGIINYILTHSEDKQNIYEIVLLCARKDEAYPPGNAIFDDGTMFYASTPQKDNFIGVKFNQILITPTAVCLRDPKFSQQSQNQHANAQTVVKTPRIPPLRSFIIVGKKDDEPAEILKECNYTDELKDPPYEGIYFINTTHAFNKIYIQQTYKSFLQTQTFALELLEIHGKISYKS